MRQLHFVGVTDDQRGLILGDRHDTDGARYTVSVDDALLGVLEEFRRVRRPRPLRPLRPDEHVTGNGAPPAEHRPTFPGGRPSFGSLTPREMQARLRSGRSVADVAREAGVDDAWVERFAAPILAEQHAAVERAGAMILQTGRRGPSARPLAESVRRNLLARGVRLVEDDLAACWSAFLHDGSEWVIRFLYRYRGRDVEAEWLADFQTGSIVAINRPATMLGYLPPPPAVGPDLAAIDLTVRTAGRPADTGAGAMRALAPPSPRQHRPPPHRPPPTRAPAPGEKEIVLRAAASVQTPTRTASSRLPEHTASAKPPRDRKIRPTNAAPTKAVPTKVVPTEAVPQVKAPTKAVPTKAAPPVKAAPPKAAPTKAAPTKAVPAEAVPTEAVRTKVRVGRSTTASTEAGAAEKRPSAPGPASGTTKAAAARKPPTTIATAEEADAVTSSNGRQPGVGEAATPPDREPHTPPLF